ncbi:hypothetical protein [Dactylosporangium salmoneum]|uniref:DUF4350 domain-containing protein n=1 Tax=Dactylosporangium salmoneum TaxID=53361 RepID=A0ABP5UA45_9ACTN
MKAGRTYLLGVLACLILAGWALWSGGIFDGPAARQVRSASVYAAPGTGLDVAAAERVIGNRRLVVLLMRPGDDLRKACNDVERAAAGTLVLVMSRKSDDKYDTYGCSQLPGAGDENFGDAFVAETTIGDGIDPFADRPLEAIKVIAVNYDRLAKADVVPRTARTISPSLPRFLVAAAAVGAVLVGSGVLYLTARRAGRLAATRRERRDRATDARTVLSATTAAVAQHIIDLDARYAEAVRRPAKKRGGKSGFAARYRELIGEYTELLDDIAAADRRGEDGIAAVDRRGEDGIAAVDRRGEDGITAADRRGEEDFAHLTIRAEALSARLRELAA